MSNVMRCLGAVLLIALVAGCPRRKTTVAPPPQPDAVAVETPPVKVDTPVATAKPAPPPLPPPATTNKVEEAKPVVLPLPDVNSRPLEELSALLKPVFFKLDSFDLDETGQATASANADLMRTNRTWKITIEGHADERGTAEYNLALGERRAAAVKAYLVSLGIDGDRLTTLSYGEEFPFDAGHDENAWAKNRRAYFQITAK